MLRRLPLTRTQRGRAGRYLAYASLLGVAVLLGFLGDWPRIQSRFFDPEIARDQFPEILTGAMRATLIFTTFGFSIAFALGLLFAAMRLSPVAPFRWLAIIYIDILRGLPALVTIIFVGFAIPITFGVQLPGTWTQGSLAIGLVGSAYIAETLRAGIQAVPPGQVEAARSLGMGPMQTFVSVTLPQGLRIIIPPLTNELILLLKDTSLLSVLGVTAVTKELTKFGRDGVNELVNSTPLTIAALIYLGITIPLSLLSGWIERRLSTR